MHPEASKLSVDYLPIDALQPDPRNPKQHSHRQIKQLARSIQRFGFNVPVLVDRSNRILAGHGRVLAAKLLGLTEVPVIRIETLSEPQARAFSLADNRLSEAPWDDRLLGEIFAELAALELDFSLEDTGFSMGEIDLESRASRCRPSLALILRIKFQNSRTSRRLVPLAMCGIWASATESSAEMRSMRRPMKC